MKENNKKRVLYKESSEMIKIPKGYKKSTKNLPDKQMVKDYYQKKK